MPEALLSYILKEHPEITVEQLSAFCYCSIPEKYLAIFNPRSLL